MDENRSEKQNQSKKQRIDILDALRGVAVVLMVVHHFLFDLVEFLNAPEQLFSNPVFDVLHYVFAGIFVALCGVSSHFSRSNLKRGLVTAGFALGISAVTYLIDMPIAFGVLHLLAVCMLFYALTHTFWEKTPKVVTIIFGIIGTAVSSWCVNHIAVDSHSLWMFGWTYKGFVSYDYFPLFPWIFVFIAGTALGFYIKENKFPQKFYTAKCPFFASIGRHSLIIYVAHQPLLYFITMIIMKIWRVS